jgi:hypothetical protein
MAQLLVTIEDAWYQNLASVRNYSEKDFEDKILKHAENIFTSYYVVKCKYSITNRNDRNKRFEPDFLLISRKFNNWYFVEVELCGKALGHTKDQLNCFHNPEYDSLKLRDYLVKQNKQIASFSNELYDLLENKDPNVIVIYDDYCAKIFKTLNDEFSSLKICVIETYKTSKHPSETYRISGDYPYEISNISPLDPIDNQHYLVKRPELLKKYNDKDIVEIDYYLKILKGVIFISKGKVFIKLPENPLPPGSNFQLEIDITDKLIIKRL